MNTIYDYRPMAKLGEKTLLNAKSTISSDHIKEELGIWRRNLKECNEHIEALERILKVIEG